MSDFRPFAAKIARALMTIESTEPVTGERLQIMKRKGDGSELALGGRCTEVVVDVIEAHLIEEFKCG